MYICIYIGKGRNGVGTNGVTANFMCFYRLLGYSREPAFIFPRVPGRTFCPNPSKMNTFAIGPISVDPVCPQPKALIGDLKPASGSVAVGGSIAYTSQVAWIKEMAEHKIPERMI